MDRYFLEKLVLQVGGVIAIGAILGGFILGYNSTYGTLVTLERSVDEEWARLYQDMYQRYGPIPDMVNASGLSPGPVATRLGEVKRAYVRWEAAAKTGDLAEVNAATGDLESAIASLLESSGGAPEIQESAPGREFLAGLERSGERISTDRQRYNRAVEEYNRTISSFPATLWVENWGFRERDPFTAGAGGTGPARTASARTA